MATLGTYIPSQDQYIINTPEKKTMTQNKLDLIMKLQRLTYSQNENESAAAKRKISKLCKEIGIEDLHFEEEWKREICTILSDFDGTEHMNRILKMLEWVEKPDDSWYVTGYIIGVAESMRNLFPENHVMCGKYLQKYEQNPINPGDYDYENEGGGSTITEENIDSYIDGNVDGYDNTRYLWNDGDGYGPLDEDLR